MSSTPSAAPVDADLALLRHTIAHLDKVSSSLASLAAAAPWSERGYFDAAQHEEIEGLFFHFLVGRRVLVSLVLQGKTLLARGEISFSEHPSDVSGDDNSSDDDVLRTVIGLAAAVNLVVYEGKLVQSFRQDKVAVAKLNEEFYRSDIPRGTFTTLSLECTDTAAGGRLQSMRSAYRLFCEESREGSDTQLAQLIGGDERVADLSEMIHSLIGGDVRGLCRELVGESIFEPTLRNKLQHAKVADVARKVGGNAKQVLRETRAHTFKGVSRLKSPTAHLIKFSDEQKREVLGMLQPGDLIFTYTAGYASDVFIPGAFKHGVTYVGSPADRAGAGLNADSIVGIYDELPDGESGRLIQQFEQSALPPQPGEKKGLDADCIEAVAEGVIFNNLSYLMDTHVNRLLVLRPRITPEERTDALVSIFRYLGSKYDFGFNFADASAVVCTEVQYHAFNGKGNLEFELTKRAGHPTLSADDIVNYYLNIPDSFDFVLLALQNADLPSSYLAKIHVGDEGKTALAGLMRSEGQPA
ncbi:hypothetical protein ACHAXT_002767 [Thalassiosira profunda]